MSQEINELKAYILSSVPKVDDIDALKLIETFVIVALKKQEEKENDTSASERIEADTSVIEGS